MLAYGEWVDENVLAPVPHRQYVFTVPRLLRPIFSRRRGLLGELCHIVERLLIEGYSGAGVKGRPGLILFVQTFGDLMTFNPHIHVLAADGAFRADGAFVGLPPIPVKLLERGFRIAVLRLLVAEAAIGERLSASMLAWRHSGFSVHNGVRVAAGDTEGRKKLAQYMLRAPLSLEKMSYETRTGMVLYRSHMAEEIRADHSLGLMEKQKAERLAELRRIVKPVNWAGYVAAAIGGLNAFFLGNDQVQLVTAWALVAVPVVLFLLALRFRDQVRLDYREGSLYPEGMTGILASGIAIGLMSLLDHHNTLGERFSQFVYPLTVATALLWLHLERRRILAQKRWLLIALHAASICFVSGFWAGGSIYQINKNMDDSEPVRDATRVTALRKSQERTGTSYRATVAPRPCRSSSTSPARPTAACAPGRA